MAEETQVNAQDLASDEIRELLLEAGAEISHEQAEQIAAFISSAGGLNEALDALVQLAEERDVAQLD